MNILKISTLLLLLAVVGCRAPVYKRTSANGEKLRVSARSLFSQGSASRVILVDGDRQLTIEGLSGKGDPETIKEFMRGAADGAKMGLTGGAAALLPGSSVLPSGMGWGVTNLQSRVPAEKARVLPQRSALMPPPPPPLPSAGDPMTTLDVKQAQWLKLERSRDMLNWEPASSPGVIDMLPVGETNMFYRLRLE